jgi:hypothetical protein
MITAWWLQVHRLARRRDAIGILKLKQMPLSRVIHHAFSPRSKEVAAKQLDLTTQLLDSLVVLLDRLIVEVGRLIKCGPELLDLLISMLSGLVERSPKIVNLPGELIQELVTFAWISRP